MQCKHCNVAAPLGDNGYLSIGTIRTHLTDLLQLIRAKRVWLSGGEPTTHPNFAEALWMIREMVPEVTLITNATRLHEPEILKPLRHGAIMCQVSLTGLDTASIAAVYGSKTAARRILTNIKGLRKSLPNNKLILSAVLTRASAGDIDAVIQFARDYGYDTVIFTFFKPIGRGQANLGFRIPLIERVKIYDRIRRMQNKNSKISVKISGGVFDHMDKIENKRFQIRYSCQLACEELQITSDAKVHCCTLMKNGLLNISIEEFTFALLNNKRKVRLASRAICPVLSATGK
jgi:MoaA/NifB/PqqE/SkfB family radical SAM enzyme